MATPTPTPPPVDNCIYKTVTLAEGEQFNLPPGAILVAATDSTAITSTCPIPTLGKPICGTLYVVIDVDDNEGHPNNEKDFRINEINVGGNIINFGGQLVITSGDNPGTLVTTTTLNSYISPSLQGIFVFKNVTRSIFSKHQDVTFTFQSLDVFQDQIEMQCQCFADVQFYKPKTITEGAC
jgi:hypothetical protein